MSNIIVFNENAGFNDLFFTMYTLNRKGSAIMSIIARCDLRRMTESMVEWDGILYREHQGY